MNNQHTYTILQRKNIIIDQIRKSWLILIFGLILFIAGTYVLLKNEKQTARKIISLDEALANVKSGKGDDNPSSYKNGQLLHIFGSLYTDEPLTEPDYNIQVQAVKLRRRVQMYQWIEETTETTYGQSADIIDTESKTYYYTMDWRDRIVDSSLFHMRMGHENPKVFPIKNRVQIATHVNIGNFEMGADAKSDIKNFIEITSDTRPDDPSIKLHSGLYYHCNDVFNPEIGDIRLQFLTAGVEGNYYTIIGKYENGLLEPYITSIDSSVLIILPGRHTVDEAFHAAHYERKLQSWGLRFIGWVLLFFAITCTSELFTVAVGDLPYMAIFLPNPRQPLYGNILLSLSLAFIATSFCWLLFRPWIGFGMVCAAISPFLFCARGIVHSYQRIDTQIN